MPEPPKSTLLTSASEHPAVWKFGYPIHHVETRAQWRTWLEHNHDAERGVWLCSWRSVTGKLRCPYPEVVEEAICFGWIDSTAYVLDNDRGLQLITPRKPKSSWSRLSRQRAADMEATGAMTDAGRHAIDVAKSNGWWTISDTVEDLIEPTDLAAALDANPAARAEWDGFSLSERKLMLWWVVSAARQSTRENRILRIVEDAALGRRAKN
jgi:uncharacterized protein YdeI (YjbR/CyaY-like superfamily)